MAPTPKLMFEVCRLLALNKTNLFVLAFLHATVLALVNLGEGDIEKRIAILVKETTSLLSLTLPGISDQ